MGRHAVNSDNPYFTKPIKHPHKAEVNYFTAIGMGTIGEVCTSSEQADIQTTMYNRAHKHSKIRALMAEITRLRELLNNG